MFEYLVSLATIACLFANFPAIYKILKTKQAKDLSLLTYIIWSVIELILLIHSVEINDIYFMISCAGLLIINVLIVILILKYGDKIA